MTLWPRYESPADLAEIESVPLEDRGLPVSTYTLLVRAAAHWPQRTAINVLPDATAWREPRSLTYAGLLATVHRYANLLHEYGVRRQDAVAIMSPNCATLIPAILAAQLAGIAAPLNGGSSPERAAELLRLSGAKVLIAAGPELDATVWETATSLAGVVDTILVLRPTGAGEPTDPLPTIDGIRIGYLDELAQGNDSDEFLGEPPTGSDLAALFHTGGTTGTPKLAAHTHTNEVANAWMIAIDSLLTTDSVFFAALPLFHVNALVVTVLAPLFKGQTVLWAGPLGYRDLPLYENFWKIVEHYRVTTMSAVPTVYGVLAQCPVDADVSSLRFALVGASPLPAAVRAGFEAQTGVPLVEGYGLTEATCASARGFIGEPREGSVGQRLPYQEVEVRDGVLFISGPTVFAGYVTGPGHQLDGLGKLTDGWLDTGDLARVDDDGFIQLAGRAKDLIIRGGHNLDPATVEHAVLAHPEVTAASAVGQPDAHAGEVPVVYVTLGADATVTADELLEFANSHVGERAAAPKAVFVLDAFPLTAIGKLYKLALRSDATQRAVADALADLSAGVETTIDNGIPVTTVTIGDDVDESVVKAKLDQFAISWKVERSC